MRHTGVILHHLFVHVYETEDQQTYWYFIELSYQIKRNTLCLFYPLKFPMSLDVGKSNIWIDNLEVGDMTAT